jgi:hypothetical protein
MFIASPNRRSHARRGHRADLFRPTTWTKEAQFDWAKVHLDRHAAGNDELFFLRSDQPYKTLLDLRKATEAPRCGASGVGSTGFYIPKLLEEIFA